MYSARCKNNCINKKKKVLGLNAYLLTERYVNVQCKLGSNPEA
jgi:hypothetical protein